MAEEQSYYQRNRERLLERAKESRKEYYERNKEAIRAKNLATYYAKKEAAQVEPRRRGRKPGTRFPDGYKKGIAASGEFTRAEFAGAIKSPDSPDDTIFEEMKLE